MSGTDQTGYNVEAPAGITGLNLSGVPTTPVNSDTSGNLLVKDSNAITVLNQIQSNTASALSDNIIIGTISAVNGTVVVPAQGVFTASISTSGTWSGVFVVEGQLADSSWTILPLFVQAAGGVAQLLPYSAFYSFTANGVFLVTGGGYSNIRVRASTLASGTASIAMEASIAQQTILSAQLGAWNIGRTWVSSYSSDSINAVPVDGSKITYSASVVGLAAALTATDIFTLTGSATKIIRIVSIRLSATQTTTTTNNILLIKRSTVNSLGISSASTAVPHDSASIAASATCLSYTANPTLGNSIGLIRVRKLYIATTSSSVDECIWEFGDRPSQAVVLRGTLQSLAINLNGTTVLGSSFNISIEWTEE